LNPLQQLRAGLRLLAEQDGLALAALRMAMGVILGYAGQRKVFLADWGVDLLGRMGVPLPFALGPLVSVLELAGGFALFIGLFTRWLGVVFALEFAVATGLMAGIHGLGGARLELMMLVGALLLACRGAGAFSLDRPGHPWEP